MRELAARIDINTTSEEFGELFDALAGNVRQIVRFSVRAPDALIDDACQMAWIRLIGHRPGVRREAVLAWLVTTANREALRLLRLARRETSLDELAERQEDPVQSPGGSLRAALPPASPDLIVELRSRLDEIRALPQRQQRLVWLQGLGLSYSEMAGYTGTSSRTVERQLLRARRRLRAA